jgi:hypothetical protein
MSQKSLAQWLGNPLSATALALPYMASLEMLLELAIYQNNAILNTNANIDDILNSNIVPRILSYLTYG